MRMRWWALTGFILAYLCQQLLEQNYEPSKHVPKNNAQIGKWFDQMYKSDPLHFSREDWQYRVYLKLLDLPKNKKTSSLLDIGTGAGHLLASAGKKLGWQNVAGIDISEVAAEQSSATSGVDVKVGDAENLPWPENSFDYITMIASLERVTNKTQALSELKRVLKPGGKAIIMGRNSKSLAWLWRLWRGNINYDGHETAYELNDYLDLFESQKLRVDQSFGDQYFIQVAHRWLGGKAANYVPLKFPPWTSFFMPSFIFILSNDQADASPSPVLNPWFFLRELMFTTFHTILDLPFFFSVPNPPDLQCTNRLACDQLQNVFSISIPDQLNTSIDWEDYSSHARISKGRIYFMKQAEALSRQNPDLISLYKSSQFLSKLSETIGKRLYTLNIDVFPNAVAAIGYDYGGFNGPHFESERINGEHWTAILLLNSCKGADLAMENQCCNLKPGEGVLFRSDLVSHFVTKNEEPECIREVISMDFSNLPKKSQRWTWQWGDVISNFERIFFH